MKRHGEIYSKSLESSRKRCVRAAATQHVHTNDTTVTASSNVKLKAVESLLELARLLQQHSNEPCSEIN